MIDKLKMMYGSKGIKEIVQGFYQIDTDSDRLVCIDDMIANITGYSVIGVNTGRVGFLKSDEDNTTAFITPDGRLIEPFSFEATKCDEYIVMRNIEDYDNIIRVYDNKLKEICSKKIECGTKLIIIKSVKNMCRKLKVKYEPFYDVYRTFRPSKTVIIELP